ncbi:beta-lactamase family protein [Olivibacter sp. SDN3]|uniref:serine hydrolase domain-containing protein n=1 Tax=Olivibacter sp. SDN3 TaxID=2764720 RepID=UPI00165148F3|nr:serine hydrolase domain-containing protein [Olivibacter sp. SDN3]QNL51931.1 beta-lactamase family protein [Olivibacter sp. SDN3]
MMIKLFKSALILIFLLQSTIVFCQPEISSSKEADLDSLISARLPSIAPGAVVLIAEKGKIVYRKAFGLSDMESGGTMKPEYIFRIGSISKQFTAVGVLQLLEDRKIGLEDHIKKFLPDYPSPGSDITIRQLLNHTSGIRNYLELDAGESVDVTRLQPEQVVNIFKKEPLKFAPGTAFDYSNSNYFLLAYLIEKITDVPYRAYLEKNIVERAKLSSTFYANAKTDSLKFKSAKAYSKFDKGYELAELEPTNLLYGAGDIVSNADDLLKWHRALYSGRLIKKSTLKMATEPSTLTNGERIDYGYGFYIKDLAGESTVEHSGSTDGYQSDMVYLPERDLLFITLFNCYEADMDWQILTNDLAKLYLEKNETEVALNENQLEKYAGLYEVIFKGVSHKMKITLDNKQLYVEALNPEARLPKVKLHANDVNKFYIKEAPLRFEFTQTSDNDTLMMTTYNSKGKDADWVKIEE